MNQFEIAEANYLDPLPRRRRVWIDDEGGEGHWEWETDGVLDSERDDEAD